MNNNEKRAAELCEKLGAVVFHKLTMPEAFDLALEALNAAHAEGYKKGAEKMREALTPSNATKKAYIGEFEFSIDCTDENGEEYSRTVSVPWTTTKEIMAAILKRAESITPPQPEAKDDECGMREAFEREFRTDIERYDLPNGDTGYRNFSTHQAWIGFKAACEWKEKSK